MSNLVVLGILGMPGGMELIIVAAVILLLFGHRLPSVMRSMGQGINEFQKGFHDTIPDESESGEGKPKVEE